MKRCPKCNRSFPDDNQKFCTIDGGLLVAAEKPLDPNATMQGVTMAIGPSAPPPPPQPDFGATIATSSSAPTVVFPKDTGPTGSTTSGHLRQQQQPAAPTSGHLPQQQQQPAAPTSAPLPPTPAAPQPPAAVSAPLPSAPLPAPAKKKSKLPLVLGILAILLILGIGGVVAAFFLVVKPRLDQRKGQAPVVERTTTAPETPNNNANTASETNANTNTADTTPAEPAFVPPPGTTKYDSSASKFEGKLADHYFDFSFYYPSNWELDPKAGVGDSGNFVKVQRLMKPDQATMENVAVRWYDSKGTYEADLPDFPKQVEEFSAQLAKAFPEYQKVRERPTKINSHDAYEFTWQGLSRGTERGDVKLWGRVVFVPRGVAGEKTGAMLTMFTTSLAPELSSIEDVGTQGEMPVILQSFRFSK